MGVVALKCVIIERGPVQPQILGHSTKTSSHLHDYVGFRRGGSGRPAATQKAQSSSAPGTAPFICYPIQTKQQKPQKAMSTTLLRMHLNK